MQGTNVFVDAVDLNSRPSDSVKRTRRTRLFPGRDLCTDEKNPLPSAWFPTIDTYITPVCFLVLLSDIYLSMVLPGCELPVMSSLRVGAEEEMIHLHGGLVLCSGFARGSANRRLLFRSSSSFNEWRKVFLFVLLLFFCTAKCLSCNRSAEHDDETLGLKLRKKGKMPARVCRCFVHVPQPITNVTFQLH